MIQIRKIKTWHGLKYAVVDLFHFYKTNVDPKTGKVTGYEKSQTYHAVEYKAGKEMKVAIFDLDNDGLERARGLLTILKRA